MPGADSLDDNVELKVRFQGFDLVVPPELPTSPKLQEVSTCRVLLLLATLLVAATLTSALIMLIPHPHPHSIFGHSAHSMVTPLAPGFVLPSTYHPPLPVLKESRVDAAGVVEETWVFDFEDAPLLAKLPRPEGTALRAVRISLPLGLSFQGILVGEKLQVLVESVQPGGNSAKADVKEGDVLRAFTTASEAWSKSPTNGVYVVDNKPFVETMRALKSNVDMEGSTGRKQHAGDVCLILQRQKTEAV